MESDNHTPTYTVSIPKEVMAQMPAETFSGRITLVQDQSTAAKAARFLMDQPLIGFDTETRPCFRKGERHKVALLQLSAGHQCFLFRLNRIGLPEAVRALLEANSVLKVGLSTKDDFNALRRLQPDLQPGGFIELQSMVKEYMISDCSLTKIYAILFGKRISKGQRLTNWEATELTLEQQRYASLDAVACVNIYDYLLSGAFKPLQSPYYHMVEPQPQQA